ncbi:Ribonuclease H-like domain containing protein [Trema orientale]|uniref:Ribonuclease H-like domain containing protein n=1 Tax=Trema orientale TaxID=63057 RepID=A0A2P5FNB3_TREOI|nr:Ribonuclease H-like domain containing protein [Trema orientale]
MPPLQPSPGVPRTPISLLRPSQPDVYSECLIFASVTLELIWKTKNEVVHQNTSPNLKHLIESIKLSSASFQIAVSRTAPTQSNIRWKPLPEYWVKVNFDAAIRPDSVIGSAICQDFTGSIIGISSYKYDPSSPLVGECLAALQAIKLAISTGASHIILEGDSRTVIQSLQEGEDLCHWEISNIIVDCRSILEKFSAWTTFLIGRVSNFAAHNIAKWSWCTSTFGNLEVLHSSECSL